MNYSTLIHSEPGHNHLNEDTARIQAHPNDPTILLGALADGQGGQAGGAAASQVAVETCLLLAASTEGKRLFDSATWFKIVSEADSAVEGHPDAGFTTLIAFCVGSDTLCGASSGDSVALLVRGTTHTVLTENQRKNPPVGSSAAFPVGFKTKIKIGDILMVLSDGVWRYVGMETIAETARAVPRNELVSELRQLQTTQNRGTLPDDFTLIVVG